MVCVLRHSGAAVGINIGATCEFPGLGLSLCENGEQLED